MKKSLSLTMALMLLLAMVMPTSSFAMAKEKNTASKIQDLETPIVEAFDGFMIVPYANHLVVDSESIGNSGTSWDQPKNYNAYRVWVKNDTNESMTITIRYSTGWFSSETHTMTIPAKKGKSLKVNNAKSGQHTISFTTSSGYVSGTVSVRVSDDDL